MRHLVISPDADSYQQQEPEEVVAIPLEGGAGRYRRDMLGGSRRVSVQWTLFARDYRYFRAFWNTAIERGAEAFTCNLPPDDCSPMVAHECRVVPGSLRIPSQGGRVYIASATLDVKPLAVDAVADAAIVAAYELKYDIIYLTDEDGNYLLAPNGSLVIYG